MREIKVVIFLVYVSLDWKYLFFLCVKEISIRVEIIYNTTMLLLKNPYRTLCFVWLTVFCIKFSTFHANKNYLHLFVQNNFFLHIERQSIWILIANMFRCVCTGMKRICGMNLPICKCERRASYRVMTLFLYKLIMHANLIQFNFVLPSFFWENRHTISVNRFTSIQNENHDEMKTCQSHKGMHVQQMLIRRLLQQDSHKIRSESSRTTKLTLCVISNGI